MTKYEVAIYNHTSRLKGWANDNSSGGSFTAFAYKMLIPKTKHVSSTKHNGEYFVFDAKMSVIVFHISKM